MSNGYGHLLTGEKEYIKQYFEYDGSARMVTVYEARANAADGEPCLKTTYEYVGATTRVEKMVEEEAEWDETWDI